jgi:methionyl-tRNA formyltransferase
MDAGIDTGPVVFTDRFEIDAMETGLTLTVKTITRGIELAATLLRALLEETGVPLLAQDPAKRTYYAANEVPNGGVIDWQLPASTIVNLVRACDFVPFPSPWGHPAAQLAGRETRIVKATLTHEPAHEPPGTVRALAGGDIAVAARDEWVTVQRVLVNGRVVAAVEGSAR